MSGNVDAINNLERLLEEHKRSSQFPGLLAQIKTPAAFHRLGRMSFESGQLARAEELFRQAGNKEAWADLGVLMVQKGKVEEAEKCFRVGKDASYNLGMLYWQHCNPARFGDAELCFLKSGSRQAFAHLGKIYETSGQWSRAIEAYLKAGTEQAWVDVALVYLRTGYGKDAEKLLKQLFENHGSQAAGYHLSNIFIARNHRRDATALNLPPLSAEEQLAQYGVTAGLASQHRYARPHSQVARLEVMQGRLEAERTKKRLIRVSTFDEKDAEKLIATVREEDLPEDLYLAAFRIRMECHHERQDVEVVQYLPGYMNEAIYQHQGFRMDAKRRRQIQIRDWLIYGCSCTPRNGIFKSPDPLPIDSESLDWPLRCVILHPCYQMQSLELICNDGVTKVVENGIIRPFSSTVLQTLDPYDEQWRREPMDESSNQYRYRNNGNASNNNNNNNNHPTNGGGVANNGNGGKKKDLNKKKGGKKNQGANVGGGGGGGGGGSGPNTNTNTYRSSRQRLPK